jgi:hypothetical protein
MALAPTKALGRVLSIATASSHGRCLGEAAAGVGRVEVWRGDVRLSMSVFAPFVWRCLSGSAVAPFPHPAHRTGRADLSGSSAIAGFRPHRESIGRNLLDPLGEILDGWPRLAQLGVMWDWRFPAPGPTNHGSKGPISSRQAVGARLLFAHTGQMDSTDTVEKLGN